MRKQGSIVDGVVLLMYALRWKGTFSGFLAPFPPPTCVRLINHELFTTCGTVLLYYLMLYHNSYGLL